MLIKIEELLKPLEHEDHSLLYDPIYDQIKYERKADNPLLSQGVWSKQSKTSNWEKVEKLCISTLQSKSKDLQIVIWLWEAWINLYLEKGFLYGLQLLEAFCKQEIYHPINTKHRVKILESADQNLSHHLTLKNLTEYKKIIEELSPIYEFPYFKKKINNLEEEIKYENPQSNIQNKQTTPPKKEESETLTVQKAFEIIENLKIFLQTESTHSISPLLLDLALQWKDKNLTEIIEDIESNEKIHKLMKKLYQ